MKRPRLNVLRTFAAAGNALSFTAAADALHISQAAVSQQIRQLEQHLGAPLFIRQNRRLRLTATGRAYLLAVHEALDRLDTITDQLFPDRHGRAVTIRCTASIATLWLTPNLASFNATHPGIDLRIRTLDRSYGAAKPSTDELEIAVIPSGTGAGSHRHLLTATITPVCAPGLLGSRKSLSNANAIDGFDLIHVLGYEADWHRWFRSHGLTGLQIPKGITFDGSLMALEAALRGDGIMLGRRPFIDQYLNSGQLIEPFAGSFILRAEYGLLLPRIHTVSQDINTVADWIAKLD